MASIYDDIDISFDWNGDLELSSGDIKDTSDNSLQSLLDQIHIICASALEDWEIYPNKGAGLNDFVGEPNTRYMGDRIHDRLRIALTSAGIVSEEDLEIRVVPIQIYKVLILIRIDAIATAFNPLNIGEKLQTALVFDTLEQGVFFLGTTPELINY